MLPRILPQRFAIGVTVEWIPFFFLSPRGRGLR
jgi:hypothetical protein